MSQTLDERARDAGNALRVAAESRPETAALNRSRPMRRVLLAAVIVVAAAAVAGGIAFRSDDAGRSLSPAEAALRSAVREAPFHVLTPSEPDLILANAVGERGKGPDREAIYQVNLWYRSARGAFHIWMAPRQWATANLGYDLATRGRPTMIKGVVWRVLELPRGSGRTALQLTRATSDGAIIEVDGLVDLETISDFAALLR